MNKSTLLPSKKCFEGIYCFDASKLTKAFVLHKEQKTVEAKDAYKKSLDDYQKELNLALQYVPKESTTFVSPLCILTQSKRDASLKNNSRIYELSAKINLSKAMIDLIDGNINSCLERTKEAGDFYKKEADCLKSLAWSCTPWEDIAQIMFECEQEAAEEASDQLLEIFLWRLGKNT